MSQTVEYLDDEGNPGADPDYVSRADVAAAWLRQTRRIPVQYAIATRDHETSGARNERDTEDTGKQTGGIFQLTLGGTRVDLLGDAALLLHPEKDPFDVDDACFLLSLKSSRDMDAIMRAAGLTPGDDDAAFFARGGAAYLTVAHNQGRGAAVETVQKWGLDWAGPGGYAERNRNLVTYHADGSIKFNGPKVVKYGDDAISGGDGWDPAYAIPPDDGNPSDGDAPDPTRGFNLRVAILAAALALLVLALAAQWGRGPLKGVI